MIMAFVIWTLVALVLAGIGVVALKSKKAVGFFAGVKPPEVKNVKKYNRAVATLWFVYAGIFELFGLTFLFLKQNSAGFLIPVIAVPILSIGLAVAYSLLLTKHQK